MENIAKVTGGKRMPKGSLLINKPNNHPYITVSNMNNNFEDLSEYQYVPTEIYPQIKNYIVNFDDLIISVAGTLGLVKKVPKFLDKANLTENANRISEIQIDIDYLQYYLNTSYIQNRILAVQTNNAQPKLALKEIRNFKIKYPPIEEQNKVSRFLFLIDKKINLLENKYKWYKDFKKYLMQQIFTQKLRFDKNCYYKNKKVKDNLIESKIEGSDNINRRLTVKLNLKGISVRESKTTEFEGATKQFIRKSGQFIYGKQNLHKGAFGIIPKELDGYLSSSDIPSFDFIGEINPKWFYYYFSRQSFYENLERLSTGTGSKRISPKDFLNIRIMIPDINEQNKIVSILNNIDKKINIISNQIVETNEFKKGLLQQMFV